MLLHRLNKLGFAHVGHFWHKCPSRQCQEGESTSMLTSPADCNELLLQVLPEVLQQQARLDDPTAASRREFVKWVLPCGLQSDHVLLALMSAAQLIYLACRWATLAAHLLSAVL